jgi:transcriptional regulator with GAF, ATPase, and Fis domain
MRVLGVAAAALAVLLLAACGGGGNSAGETAQALTADEFRRQADGICRRYEDKLNALDSPSSIEDLQDFVARAVPLIEQGNEELHGLTPPDELEADWDAAMKAQDENVETMHDLEDAVQNNDLSALQTITKSLDANQAESERLAQKLGLKDCGEPQTG